MENYNSLMQFYFDFDGTIANKGEVTSTMLAMLRKMGELKLLRVIVTGRSLYSFKRAVSEDFPIDYLIFSSGAGVLDWKNKELIYEQHLEQQDIVKIKDVLQALELSYMIHDVIPENHYFSAFQGKETVADFYRRIHIYKDFQREWIDMPKKGVQFLAITDENPMHYLAIKKQLKQYTVIRATSPLDHHSIWIEIFPFQVSKAKTVDMLAKKLGFSSKNAIAFGNDYNDLDLLYWAKQSFIVRTAAKELQATFQTIDEPQKDGVVSILTQYIVS